jgi:DNA-3-methyladenine glycosylase I
LEEGMPLWPDYLDAGRGRKRCGWAGTDPLYIEYHDREWGVPVTDERRLFEFLILETAQAGLRWISILRRREGYRRAYRNFEPRAVAAFGASDRARLLKDPGIIRNRLKVEASIVNARAFLAVQKEFGSFARYAWSFAKQPVVRTRRASFKGFPSTSPAGDAWTRDLRRRGFKFVGRTMVYAYMQAVGMVNDHLVGCFRHGQIKPFTYKE